MLNPPTLMLAISPSLPKDIPTIQPPLPTTQTQIQGPSLAPKRLPKRSLFRRSFTWITPRHNSPPSDEIRSPKTPDTKYNLDESFQMKPTTRRGACVWPKLPFPTDVMQAGKEEVREPHPGRRVDIGQGDEEQKRFKIDQEEESMKSALQYHIFLRTSIVSMHPPTYPNRRKNPHTPQQNSKPPQPPPPSSSHHTSVPLSREKSNASTTSSRSVETFITHVRESFAWRESRDFAEEKREEQEGIFKDEGERGWGVGDGVLESSVGGG